jgi:5-methylcytosine-specific restriction endonuclease McrA
MGRKNQSSYYSKPIARIHADFGGICALCGNFVELSDASRDHIIPRSKGGGNGRDNIQLTHKSCNNLKGDISYPVDWQEQLKRDMVIPKGYQCRYCSQEINKQHKDYQYVAKVIVQGKIVALHTWCNEERIKYGKQL